MKFTQSVGPVGYSDKVGRSHWSKRFDLAQNNFERSHFATRLPQEFQSSILSSLLRNVFQSSQYTGRQNGDVRRQMGKIGVKLPPKPLDELPYRMPNVGYQRVKRIVHGPLGIIACLGRGTPR